MQHLSTGSLNQLLYNMHHLRKQHLIIGTAELLLTVPMSLTAHVITCLTDS